MVVVDERVAELVLLVADVDDGVRRLRSLRDVEPLGHRTRDDVAHDNLQGEYRDAAAELVAVVELFDEMGRYTVLNQIFEYDSGYLVVKQPLRLYRRLLDVVVCRGVVLVMDNDKVGVVRQEHLFCLALVEHFALFHSCWELFIRFLCIVIRRACRRLALT